MSKPEWNGLSSAEAERIASGPKRAPGPEGDGGIERDAVDGSVDARQVGDVRQSHEGPHAREARIDASVDRAVRRPRHAPSLLGIDRAELDDGQRPARQALVGTSRARAASPQDTNSTSPQPSGVLDKAP